MSAARGTPPDGIEPPGPATGQGLPVDSGVAHDTGDGPPVNPAPDTGAEPPIDLHDPALPRLRRLPAFWIASGFGAGLAPWAPGTVGTLVAVLPWLGLRELPWPAYLVVVLMTFALGVWAAQQVIDRLGVDDPGVIVIDEWIGLWIALFLAPPGWGWLVAGVLVFRLFDIAKPWPVGWIDRHLHGGFGAMLDDALAGLYALIVLQLAARLL